MPDKAPASKSSTCIIFADDSCQEKLGSFAVDWERYHTDTVFEGSFLTEGCEAKSAVMKFFGHRDLLEYESEFKALTILQDSPYAPDLLTAGCTPGSKGKIPGGMVLIKSFCRGERLPWDEFWNQCSDFDSENEVWVALKKTLEGLGYYGIELLQIPPDSVLWDKVSGRVYITDFFDWEYLEDDEEGSLRHIADQLYELTRNSQMARGFDEKQQKGKGKKVSKG
ncbi:hypothetical protein TWF506_007504 [Arthrobotrys conoides]|uniref:Uncharacterized protein n=1 Tax=Arthrobotrys conoides TaxID=74498 RepID=A0AAN8RNA4_9PEZI